MRFTEGYIYHIYNQGNNRRLIYFSHANYMYFLKKVKIYISPYSDILAWCLMPNHFHLLVYINKVYRSTIKNGSTKILCVNDSIGVMLRSYTRAINKQEGTSGSLFRKETKAICVNCPDGISPSWILLDNITKLNIQDSEKQYPKICFNYIHQNPVKTGLVFRDIDWRYSSAKTYQTNIKDYLVNKKLAEDYGLF